MNWDVVPALVPRPEDGIYFKKGGVSKHVEYICPPLPLLKVCWSSHVQPFKDGGVTGRRLSAVSLSEGQHLLCVGCCSSIGIYSISEQTGGKGLSWQRGGRGPEAELEQEETYKDWSDEHSTLVATLVATYQLPGQETLRLLDTELVRRSPFLCAITSCRLLLFELPSDPGCQWQAVTVLEKCLPGICSAKLSPYIPGQVMVATENGGLCMYKAGVEPIVVRTPLDITTSHTLGAGGGEDDGDGGGSGDGSDGVGRCVDDGGRGVDGGGNDVSNDGGGGDVSDDGGDKDDVSDGDTGGDGCPLRCVFGSHPGHVLWLWKGTIYSIDLRRAKLPVSSEEACHIVLGSGVYGKVLCMWLDPQQPFTLHLATSSHLLVVDIRQPSEPLLSYRHHLPRPPLHLTVTHTSADSSLVLLCSVESNIVFSYSSTSHVSLAMVHPPHVVCIPSDVLMCLKRSELCGAIYSHVRHRLAKQLLGQGTALLALEDNSYAAITLTRLGDVFYQCWSYSHSFFSGLAQDLSACHYLGYKLWVTQQMQHYTTDHSQPEAEHLYPGILKDMTSIAKSLLLAPSETTVCQGQQSISYTATTSASSSITEHPSYLSHHSSPVHLSQDSKHSGHGRHQPPPGQPRHDGGDDPPSGDGTVGRNEVCAGQALDVLRQFCEDLPLHTTLDIALLQQWQSCELKARLFDDDDDDRLFDNVSDQVFVKDELKTRLFGEDEFKIKFDDSEVNRLLEEDCINPCSCPHAHIGSPQTPVGIGSSAGSSQTVGTCSDDETMGRISSGAATHVGSSSGVTGTPVGTSSGDPRAPVGTSSGDPRTPVGTSSGDPRTPMGTSSGDPRTPVGTSSGNPRTPVGTSSGNPRTPVGTSNGTPKTLSTLKGFKRRMGF